VVERIGLSGGETVLDAGCGTGRVTRLIAERLPRGRVIGVDASRAMVAEAARLLADLAPRVEVRHGDLLELELTEPVDLVVSTATFHWILDHDGLFARMHAALRPGGRLVAQCGGVGNIHGTLEAAAAASALPEYAPALADMPPRWAFPDPATTEERLRRAGFEEARAWLEEAPARFDGVERAAEFLSTVVLRCHLERLPPELRDPFAREVAGRLGGHREAVEVDYVRLNMDARRPLEPAPR
jgi:trans-aconitate 2-methyltransferase